MGSRILYNKYFRTRFNSAFFQQWSVHAILFSRVFFYREKHENKTGAKKTNLFYSSTYAYSYFTNLDS